MRDPGKRVGIYSGTFDPVHAGHIRFAMEAQKKYNLQKVFFLVEPRPRRKQGVKALEHRIAMVKRAIGEHDGLGLIVLEQARFTPHETLPILKARFKGEQLYMLMGEDMLDHLADWPHVEELIHAVHFVIGLRKSSDIDGVVRTIENLQATRGLRLQYSVFQAASSQVTSSEVRAQLRRGTMPQTLPKAVAEYITTEQLYFPG